jgi:hypothetical protein
MFSKLLDLIRPGNNAGGRVSRRNAQSIISPTGDDENVRDV